MMAGRTAALAKVYDVLLNRSFTEKQVRNLIPSLSKEYIDEPRYLAEIVDAWNQIMGSARVDKLSYDTIPNVAKPPNDSIVQKNFAGLDMTHILSDIAPDLLRLDPEMLHKRHRAIQGLGLVYSVNEHWLLLFNAPHGFYLQDWQELTKKLYYLEHKVIDLLFDKKQVKEMKLHPITRSAASVESTFDHIRTRYLFTHRAGYKELSYMYPVQTASDNVTIKDLILSDNETFLKKFTPFCSEEEYLVFSDLIKNHEVDEDDAELFEKYAELDSLRH